MRDFHTIGIVAGATKGKGDGFTLDGKPLRGVRKMDVSIAYDSATIVRIEIIANVNGEIADAQVEK